MGESYVFLLNIKSKSYEKFAWSRVFLLFQVIQINSQKFLLLIIKRHLNK